MARDPRSIPLGRIERAAATLRPLEREVLRLAAGEGLRNDAIAARLGITPEAAEGLLADALYGFGRALDRQERPWWRSCRAMSRALRRLRSRL